MLAVAWQRATTFFMSAGDVFSAAFVDRFARFAGAFARLHLAEIGRPPMVCPINEISFLAWVGGTSEASAENFREGRPTGQSTPYHQESEIALPNVSTWQPH